MHAVLMFSANMAQVVGTCRVLFVPMCQLFEQVLAICMCQAFVETLMNAAIPVPRGLTGGPKFNVEKGPPQPKIWPNVPCTIVSPVCHVFVIPYSPSGGMRSGRNMECSTSTSSRCHKQKFLSAACVLVQEIVEDSGLAERFRGWAVRWGDDDPDTCRLHREVYNILERHTMGITASQFVWQRHEENETAENGASGGHDPSSMEGDGDALAEHEEANAREHLLSSRGNMPGLQIRGSASTVKLRRGDMTRLAEQH